MDLPLVSIPKYSGGFDLYLDYNAYRLFCKLFIECHAF